jgi:hypothetical protein
MRLLKSSKLLGIVNSYVVDSPQPSNLSYAWNFGSLLATCLGIQIVTGIILAMHYTPNIDLAFISVEHIMRDVNYGWMIRYIHANVASFFFIFVYLHIGRGLYYGSYNSPRVLPWSIGVIMLVLMMGIAFLGYVLPYGQMSLWGATVITNMLSAVPWIGQDFVQFSLLTMLGFYTLLVYVLSEPIHSTDKDSSLPTIGSVNWGAMRGQTPRSVEKKGKFLDVPYSFLAMLLGLIDGDGYLKVTKTTKGGLQVEMVLSLHIDELPLLQHIQATLGIGRVVLFPKITTAKYIIGRVDLQEVFFPLLHYHGLHFLTITRTLQYNTMMYVFANNITRFADIPSIIPSVHVLPLNSEAYLLLPFFGNWLVGFTIAEGSFYVKSSGEFFFSLRQRTGEAHIALFGAFK